MNLQASNQTKLFSERANCLTRSNTPQHEELKTIHDRKFRLPNGVTTQKNVIFTAVITSNPT
jgi:hypothetical protein